ncbi:MAG TPA: hypothetical protein VF458_10245 [Ktedonobacteraceae bacterium]
MEDQQAAPRQPKQPPAGPNHDTSELVNHETMSLESVRDTMYEEQGYDAPFATFTWRYWLEAQTRSMQCFSRFLRAVEEHHPDHAIMIVLEMQEITTDLLLEAYALSTNPPLPDLPAEPGKHLQP